MPEEDNFEFIDAEELEALDGPQSGKTDMQNVSVHLAGEDNLQDALASFGKRRVDEEDFWPETESEREELAKAETERQSLAEDDDSMLEVLEPPLPLSYLVTAFEESNSLRQNVDAMVTNVDGFGFTLESVINPESKELHETVSDQLLEAGNEAAAEAIDNRVAEIVRETAREKRRLSQFFAFSADESFIELRRASREDLEVLGNFTWEVLRDDNEKIRRFVHVPFYTIRLTKKGKPVEITVKRKVDPITYEEFTELKRFRRFVQTVGGVKLFFKEFGDPRFMSRKSGRYYKTKEELVADTKHDPADGEATEIVLYKIRALRGAYGQPRWIGNLLSVLGSRLSEEVNYFYFNNKAIPPMIIFVENGRLAGGAAEKLADFMKQVKGDTKKFWRVAILEGESSDDARNRGVTWTGQPRFKVVKLSSEQLKDGLFQDYDERNRDKVGESWRMPRLLRGDTRDFNRGTASTAKSFGEEQVFQPERDRFDSWIDRVFGPELGMSYHRFKSNAPVVREPITLSEMVHDLVKVGVLVPKEGRKIAEDIFNREFKDIDEPWVNQPLVLSLAGIQTGTLEPEDTEDELMNSMIKVMKKANLGSVGERVDVAKSVTRLLEMRRAFSELSVQPDSRGDREGDRDR